MAKARRPAGLKRSATLWDNVTGTYTLRPDELRVLEDACREADLIDRLQADIAKAPLTVPGSMGQKVPHPSLQEIRQHRATLARMLKQLGLPDAPSEPAGGREGSTSDRARRTAHARWSRRSG